MLAEEKILKFLYTQEIAKLHLIDKAHYETLVKSKALKKSIWRGDLKSEYRANFWIYQTPLYL